MLRYFLLFTLCALAACAEKQQSDSPAKTDSAAPPQPKAEVFTTDSGRLEVPVVNGEKNGKAMLYNSAGKMVGEGRYQNGKKVGIWKEYGPNGNLVAVKQFTVNGIRTLAPADFDMRTFENREMNIRMNVPRNWVEIPSPNPSLMAAFEKQLNDTSLQRPAMNVVKGQLGKGETLDKIAADQLKMMHDNVDRLDVVDEQKIQIGNNNGFRRYGTYSLGELRIGFITTILVSGSDVYVFNGIADNSKPGNMLDYQAVLDEMADSFQKLK
ncbi:MAG: DcrB-related protein [Bacteroidia bacterium]|jgi:hypothetical protein|nr:DcrB-related protein [Bacteroidia bacterium]